MIKRKDRITQAQSSGWLCDQVQVVKRGYHAIADFVCPSNETRTAFGNDCFIIWADRVKVGRFEDTNQLFGPPKYYDVRVEPE